jgi:hypothetical protein
MLVRVVALAMSCGLAVSGGLSSSDRIPSLLRVRGGVAAAPRKMAVQVQVAQCLFPMRGSGDALFESSRD